MSESTPARPPILPCPRCQAPPHITVYRQAVGSVACINGCYTVQGTVADWNDLAISRTLLRDLRRIATHCQNETQIPDVDGPTTFELAWDAIHGYQVRVVWWHHDGGIDENDAAGETPDEAIGRLAAQLKRRY